MAFERQEFNMSTAKFEELTQKISELLYSDALAGLKVDLQEVLRLIHLLQVYQLELEMQNEELRKTQIALQQSQQDRQLHDKKTDFGFLTLNAAGLILKSNATLASILGMESKRLIGRKISTLISPNDQDIFHFFRQRVLKTGEFASCELNLLGRDGSHVAVQLQSEGPQQDLSGEKRWKIIVRNRSCQNLESLSPVGIFKIDADGYCLHVNPTWLQITSVDSHAAIGSRWTESIHPEDRDKISDTWLRATGERSPFKAKYRFLKGSGDEVWVLGQATPEIDTQGRLTGYMGTITDITAQMTTEQMLLTSQELAHLGSWDWDIPGGQLIWSDETYRIFGLSPQESPPTYEIFLQSIHPADRILVESSVEKALQDPDFNYQVEHRVVRKKGAPRYVIERGKVQRDAAGNAVRMIGTVQDITSLRSTENQLALLERILEHTDEGVFISDQKASITSVNPALCALYGYPPEEIIGQTPNLFISHHQDHIFYARMWQTLLKEGYWENEIWNRRKDGEVFPVKATIQAVHNLYGEITHFVCIYRDLSDIKKRDEKLLFTRSHDALTGLPNRVLFLDRLGQALRQIQREKRQVAVVMLDMDLFRKINDSLGHALGDLLLKQIALRIQALLRSEDTLCRLGGNAFTIFLQHLESMDGVTQFAQRLLGALAKPFQVQEYSLHLSASIGLTIAPNDGDEAETLLKNAELAMYRAKERGRGCFHFFNPHLSEQANQRLALENNLRQGLDQQEFLLHHQPKVDLLSGQIVGMESLVRWNRGEQLVSPDAFIPVAEESGLIIPLGSWVLRQACLETVKLPAAGDSLRVAVNLSPRQFRDPKLLQHIDESLLHSGLPPERLELEITESMLAENVEEAIASLNQLKDRGIHIAMDDFGTGYSSLNTLKRFPIDTLKIDQSFIRDLTSDSEDAQIVTAIVHMAQSLNLKLVAEGVETREQLAFLESRGCDQIQGYLFSKPLPYSQFSVLLTQGKSLKSKPATAL
uniref:Putative Diguanylate cyclase/phosphodiesterase [including GGDEF and EAL domain] n=1 Tax=Magnetococcus massalia (strain MO-1) TaxID=451514 RepID=A0A1S7LFQ9_MAGMO|nr:putative Diguanylate cyclase/phosphodiesterase [including GGDEF and EAL domain] [Candidatus Magnetococcus massalia]